MAADSDGTFTTLYPGFAEFLRRLSADRDPEQPWSQARNFLLDENVPDPRVASYGDAGAKDGFAATRDWLEAHEDYLSGQVILKPATKPRTLDPARTESCPETFRYPENFSTYGAAHKGLDLGRVIDAGSMERLTGRPASRIAAAAREIIRARAAGEDPDPLLLSDVRGVLQAWNSKSDLRPAYVAFLAEHVELFQKHPADWADTLRDRLGLAHLDPGDRGRLDVILFKYPVGAVPNCRGLRDQRPLAVPTVLDTSLSSAFCPAPRNEICGRVMDLAASFEKPHSEVVHPYLELTEEHLYRVGTIRTRVPADLWEARAAHL
ncbi:MAG: hypothetical protein GY856_01575, partial [bacterium]|nr:hypothetical protein [bacterium]